MPGAVMARVAGPGRSLSAGGVRTAPGELAHHDRAVTQAVARQVHAAGHAGAALVVGARRTWASTVLFTDVVPVEDLTFGTAELMTLRSPAVIEAARYCSASPRKAPHAEGPALAGPFARLTTHDSLQKQQLQYVGSGQKSADTCVSSVPPTPRSRAIAGFTSA